MDFCNTVCTGNLQCYRAEALPVRAFMARAGALQVRAFTARAPNFPVNLECGFGSGSYFCIEKRSL